MRIRCLFNSFKGHPDLLAIYPDSYTRDYDDVAYSTTPGKEYNVYSILGMRFRREGIFNETYIILNDWKSPIPVCISAQQCEIIDPQLYGEGWCFRYFGEKLQHRLKYALGPERFVTSCVFFWGVLATRPRYLNPFMEWCNYVDSFTCLADHQSDATGTHRP